MKTFTLLSLLFASSFCFSQLKKKEMGCYKGSVQAFELYLDDEHSKEGVFVSSAEMCLNIAKDSCSLFLNDRVFQGTYSDILQQGNAKKIVLDFNHLGQFKVLVERKEKQLVFFGRGQQPSVILTKQKKSEKCN